MRIGVIGASGKAGALIATEARNRGHEVTALVRDKSKVEGKGYKVIQKDLFALTAGDVKDLDAVVNAFGTPFDGSADEQHQTATEHLLKVFKDAPKTRLLFVGGAASLYKDPLKKSQVLEDIPAEWQGVPSNMAKALGKIRESDVNWTYFSPAISFDPAGERSGAYTPGTDFVINNKAGESYISYADAAVAIIDEIESAFYIKKRFTAVAEKKTPASAEAPTAKKDAEYYGLLKEKPKFEGLSRYRQPYNYELAGRKFRLVMDRNEDYFVSFLTGHTLEWSQFDQPPKKYYYECNKADETTYFVNWEVVGAQPRAGFTLIVDMEQRLVTLCKTYTRFSTKYPPLVESEFDFGAIEIDGFPLPKIRHGYTSDLVGKRILWNYSPEFVIIHVYYSTHYIRATFPPDRMPFTTPEAAAEWEANPYDEKAVYIKIKRNVYLVSAIEQNMSKRGLPGNSLLFLMDLERVHDVGRSFGHTGNTQAGDGISPENYMFAAYGEFVASDGKLESAKNLYLVD
jgi:putative NADH-flavin reductase